MGRVDTSWQFSSRRYIHPVLIVSAIQIGPNSFRLWPLCLLTVWAPAYPTLLCAPGCITMGYDNGTDVTGLSILLISITQVR